MKNCDAERQTQVSAVKNNIVLLISQQLFQYCLEDVNKDTFSGRGGVMRPPMQQLIPAYPPHSQFLSAFYQRQRYRHHGTVRQPGVRSSFAVRQQQDGGQ